MKILKKVLTIVFAMIFLLWVVTRIILAVSFERDIGEYLRRAAAASTVQLAKENLDIALKNIESNGLTSGYTSVLSQTLGEDVGFWYKNLKASRSELDEVKTMSFLEKKIALAEVRRTLFGHGVDESVVVFPKGISIHLNNRLFALWGISSGILTLIFWLFWVTHVPSRRKNEKHL